MRFSIVSIIFSFFLCYLPLKMHRLMVAFGLFLYIQLLIRPVDAGGYTSLSLALDYRKLFCRGDLPKHRFGLITWHWRSRDKQFSYKDFTSLADLCSAHGNPRGNLGGTVRNLFFSGARLLLILVAPTSALQPVSYTSTLLKLPWCF